ncbi:unnamed protein product, partial [Thlaspi arvense]
MVTVAELKELTELHLKVMDTTSEITILLFDTSGLLTLTNTESIVDDEIPNQVTPTSKRKVDPIIEVLED